MYVDQRKGGSTISNRAWETTGEEEASGVPERKVSIPTHEHVKYNVKEKEEDHEKGNMKY